MHLVFAFVLLILLPTTSLAVDLTGGRAAIFLDKEGTAKDLALVKFSREPGLVAQLPDPTTGISSLRINSNTAWLLAGCRIGLLEPGSLFSKPEWGRNPEDQFNRVLRGGTN